MELWTLMWHRNYRDWCQAEGSLMGGFYSDIESVCRMLRDDPLERAVIVSIEYQNDGTKALLTSDRGKLYGAYKDRLPMREDVPTKW